MTSAQTEAVARSLAAKYGDKNAVAEMLDVSPRTVEAWTQRRLIPHVRVSHRCVRYRLDEIVDWFESFHVPVGGASS
jgi:hypothetical protein